MSILREQRPIAKRCIEAGLYQKLVIKLGSRFTIKQNMVANLEHPFPQGEFLHIIHQARNVFVFVARTNTEGKRQALTEQDVEDLRRFQQALLPADLLQHAYRLAPFLIIASNDKAQYAHLNKQGFCFMSKMVVSRVVSLIKNKALAKASPAIQQRLQSLFSPETSIPAVLSANGQSFLDQTQDKILKQSLYPTSYSSRAISKTHLYQGAAGSGKTLVLLQRAKLLRQLHPTWKIVVIAPNAAALHTLQKMHKVLDPDADTNTEIIGFQHWCRRHIKGVLQFIDTDETLELAERVVEQSFAGQRLTAKQLVQELVYSADRALDTLERYLAAKRYDPSLAMGQVGYTHVWEAMQEVAQALRQQNLHMSCDLAPLLWYQVVSGKVTLPQYEAILIDDAHTLTPIGFKLLYQARAVDQKSVLGHVFMMANRVHNGLSAQPQVHHTDFPAQQLHGYHTDTWREAGIKVTEHETVLNQCYRSSAGVLQLANKLFQVDNQAAVAHIQKSSKHWRWPYKTPVLFHVTDETEAFNLLIKEVRVLLDRGMPAKDILIIQAGHMPVRQMAMFLRQQLGVTVSLFGDPQQSEQTIYITTLDTLSAVESPVVFIIGLQHLFANETIIASEITKKLYTGIMCTQHQLTLMLVADRIPSALQVKELKVVKNPMKKNNVYPLFPVSAIGDVS